MKTAEEYRRRAAECEALAAKASTIELRDTYYEMARTWNKLAGERIELIIPKSERAKA